MAGYSRYGGGAYMGNDAWNHINDRAGKVMGKFVQKYVRTPLLEVDSTYTSLQTISLVNLGTTIRVQMGD